MTTKRRWVETTAQYCGRATYDLQAAGFAERDLVTIVPTEDLRELQWLLRRAYVGSDVRLLEGWEQAYLDLPTIDTEDTNG